MMWSHSALILRYVSSFALTFKNHSGVCNQIHSFLSAIPVIALGTLLLCDLQRHADIRLLCSVLIVTKRSMLTWSSDAPGARGSALIAGCQLVHVFIYGFLTRRSRRDACWVQSRAGLRRRDIRQLGRTSWLVKPQGLVRIWSFTFRSITDLKSFLIVAQRISINHLCVRQALVWKKHH